MRIPADNVAEFLNKLSRFVDEDGARNLNKISEELDIPYQTLRFRMQRLRESGYFDNPDRGSCEIWSLEISSWL